jgi:hypothetical protein
VTDVGSRILLQRYRVERDGKGIVHEKAAGNRKVATNLATDGAVNQRGLGITPPSTVTAMKAGGHPQGEPEVTRSG